MGRLRAPVRTAPVKLWGTVKEPRVSNIEALGMQIVLEHATLKASAKCSDPYTEDGTWALLKY